MSDVVCGRTEEQSQLGKIFAAIELSKARWVIAVRLPHLDKVSVFEVAGGAVELWPNVGDGRGHAAA